MQGAPLPNRDISPNIYGIHNEIEKSRTVKHSIKKKISINSGLEEALY